jgi:hypothetical protein
MYQSTSQHQLREAHSGLLSERANAVEAVRLRQQRDRILGKSVDNDPRTETFSTHQETLIIMNLSIENDPVNSWTIPASTETWRMLSQHDGAQSRGGSAIVLATSSHIRKTLRLHSEVVRQVLATKCPRHCVISNGAVGDSATLWRQWKPPQRQSDDSRAHRAEVDLGTHTSRFPGELLPPLGGLLSRQDALLRKQSMYDVV